MPDPHDSPAIAIRAGNRTEVALGKQLDPVYLAKLRWNNELVLAGDKPTGSEAPRDGAPYTVAGSAFSWPHLKVAWRAGFQPGPQVRFQQREDGLHLTVVFEEDPAKRVPGTLPFDVQIKSVRLVYGTGAADFLEFTDPLPEPQDPTKGPAFTIEADALVPLDERRARLVAALQAVNGAQWVAAMEFQWVQTITQPPTPTPPAHGHGHGGILLDPAIRLDAVLERPATRRFSRDMLLMHAPAAAAVAHPAAAAPAAHVAAAAITPAATELKFNRRPDLLIAILNLPPQPKTTTAVRTISFSRTIAAEYPNNTPENRPIFAAVNGDYAQIGWKNTAHGWFQPTPIQDTVYCLPHAYRLQVDAATGLPSIQAILLRKNAAGALTDTLDPKNYTVRLTLRVRPDFDVAQLQALRGLIRAESSNTVPFADLVLGGYSGARFEADPALAGLGELFAGTTAANRDAINPEEGFTLTFEGNAEFIDLLFQRLKGEGIEGTVQLDLQEPGGAVRKQNVPVVLTLRKLAAVSLPWTFAETAAVPPPAPAPAAAPDGSTPPAAPANPADLLPHDIVLRNPTSVEVTLGSVSAHALRKSPITGHVDEWYRTVPDGTWPLTLAPGASQTVRLTIDGDQPLYNAWDVSLVDCHTTTSAELVLSGIFDAATSGVRGWQVAIDCPPLAFFDQLTPEDQARLKDIVALEVEVRRKGSSLIEEVRLTRQAAAGSVLLSRTVADFVSDRSVGRSTFEYRQRALRLTRADEWSPWREETGSALSVFLA